MNILSRTKTVMTGKIKSLQKCSTSSCVSARSRNYSAKLLRSSTFGQLVSRPCWLMFSVLCISLILTKRARKFRAAAQSSPADLDRERPRGCSLQLMQIVIMCQISLTVPKSFFAARYDLSRTHKNFKIYFIYFM